MFYNLSGNLIFSDTSSVAIECGGIGFKCTVTLNTLKHLPPVGCKVTLFTYLHIREDAMELFGFYTEDELEFFKLLISVSGVGPKVAIGILSDFEPDKLSVCIVSGDSKTLTKANGVGAKLAQRIILELKDKIGNLSLQNSGSDNDAEFIAAMPTSDNISEAALALTALGYSQSEAMSALSRLDPNMSVEQLISAALKAGDRNA